MAGTRVLNFSEDHRDTAFLALINAHRATSGYSALPDLAAVRAAYMASPKDGMGERWLEHERRKSDAALDAVAKMVPDLPRLGPSVPASPRSRADLDRMADAIHALPGAPVMGRAIGASR